MPRTFGPTPLRSLPFFEAGLPFLAPAKSSSNSQTTAVRQRRAAFPSRFASWTWFRGGAEGGQWLSANVRAKRPKEGGSREKEGTLAGVFFCPLHRPRSFLAAAEPALTLKLDVTVALPTCPRALVGF